MTCIGLFTFHDLVNWSSYNKQKQSTKTYNEDI